MDSKVISPPPSKELLKLAKKAAKQQDAVKKMTSKELDQWAEQLAEDSVNAGEAEYGPDYRKTE